MSSKYHQTCGIIWLKEMIYTSERLDWTSFFSLFLRNPCMKSASNKLQVSEKGSTVGTHRIAVCLLKNICEQNITNILSIKNSIILMMSVSENFLLESVCFWFAKNYPCLVWPYLLAFQTYKITIIPLFH